MSEHNTNEASEQAQSPAEGATPDEGAALANLEKRVQEKEEQLLRLHAEFENFKKRNNKERHDAVRFANQQIIKDLLTMLDNLDLAISHIPAGDEAYKAIRDGVEMTRKQFANLLEKYGLQEVPTDGEFDPNHHEAVMQEASPDHENNHIVAVLQKGYLLHDRVVRPAMVKVCKK
ncbi:nucleotide exchange factor GrpE [Desulfurispirillum indicum]|uniref:Protein GrpE n=1 Tax=Desulfurispirillum indicum (strain ATCC BAA-1389 / DSM 22839 / S5) TaxID=653733 RepID=E6W4N4_DESIS|nr:nucleotide exchange factor GrpE [Desulfurispirillum indicum]ADU67107.1 GrpE protein [Desulfurispirillum indicum S5]UCZ56431.1 nucleotide exchange factor GrpE [Desulfurispirillum indicum]